MEKQYFYEIKGKDGELQYFFGKRSLIHEYCAVKIIEFSVDVFKITKDIHNKEISITGPIELTEEEMNTFLEHLMIAKKIIVKKDYMS